MRGLVIALLLVPAPARAVRPWKSDDGSSSLEVRAFYKTFGTFLVLPRGLVDGTEALAALSPEVQALPRYGGTSAHTARIWGRLALGERFELQAGWQLAALIASDRTLVGAGALGAVPVAGSETASRRLVDFDPVLAQRDGFLLQQNLDLLSVKAHFSFGDIIVGRQVLSWGSGRLWNPTDLLSPFAPTDIDREVRHGIDAVRASIPLAKTAQLELLWLPQQRARDQGGVARVQFNVGGFDVAPSLAKYVRDVVIGLDATGDLGPVGVHAEGAWTLDLDGEDRFLRAVVGAEVRPAADWVLTAEYYFNGWGATDPSDYVSVLRSDRVARGEVFGAGRHYLGLLAAWQPSELLSVRGTTLVNLGDPSLFLLPTLEYWAEQSLLVRVGVFVPVGRPPDPSALQRLTPEDAANQTDAWREATRTLGLRSQYGASPFGLFVQVALYLL